MNRLPEHSAKTTTASHDAAFESRLSHHDEEALAELARRIRTWGRELGFGAVGISDIDLSDAEQGLASWLEASYHGEMDYMAKHGLKRARPAELVAGTRRVITARMAYLPAETLAKQGAESVPTADGQKNDWRAIEWSRLTKPAEAVVSIYARGRDYHKVMRNRLQQLAERIEAEIGPYGHRAFTDSAPVLEVALAQKAGNGWRGKHTLLLDRDAGSLFFLGEIYVDIPLPADPHPEQDGAHCGQCTRCIGACPTGAIVAPYRVDARRCISYLTIELHGSIPEDMRPLIGNRVYGCDDCQLVCPWNKFAQAAPVADFDVRHGLDRASLVALFAWSADDFDTRMQGSAIRRIGHERWLRNIAVAMGNALRSTSLSAEERAAIVEALRARAHDASDIVREHVNWALRQESGT
ncbi:Epoxyqueuosine (oQ) reductase QueG [Candidatus Burkholderia verschuerenii]|uniref:Epoxyqueuosine reductase n=1 Tax=Candidatus Burkholderia verschuerenii TaxID=242163 RepID=A0A0L0MCG5_9BURK|nr:tRNA epoxyqueuosine(34) reductase QueG [Candidatus Burkholderia verschuerenii]KND60033.1 Epoxyqueuosine (oQ) reductase QueG [Candidatus Burkholderia verschuerenii]